MSEFKKAAMTEELVAQRIKVGDTFKGHTVKRKVWKRDTPGNYKVHIVYVNGGKEEKEVLDPKLSFTTVSGYLTSGEYVGDKPVQTQFDEENGGWVVTETLVEPVEI